MMIPMLTPLNATIMNVIFCLAGGTLLSVGLGVVSNNVLQKTNLMDMGFVIVIVKCYSYIIKVRIFTNQYSKNDSIVLFIHTYFCLYC